MRNLIAGLALAMLAFAARPALAHEDHYPAPAYHEGYHGYYDGDRDWHHRWWHHHHHGYWAPCPGNPWRQCWVPNY